MSQTLTPPPGQTTAATLVERAGGPLGYVRRLARASGTNFYYAFLTLPKARREAIVAVYAFCHSVDDAVDEARDPQQAAAALAQWRRDLAAAFAGHETEPVTQQAAAAATRFRLPRRFFEQVIAGVEMDLTPRRFANATELAGYCDLVAGAVGRLCVRIFGLETAEADAYAAELGAALQLTNILRDIGPDARRGRFYLPQDALRAAGLDEAEVVSGTGAKRRLFLSDQAERARQLFAQAEGRERQFPRTACAAAVMRAIYHQLLERIVAANFPVDRVVRVPRPIKAALAAKVWLQTRLR